MNLTLRLSRRSAVPATEARAIQQPIRPVCLTRAFVETGDERCPIAGIWSRLDCDPIADDPESTRPAMRRLRPWRAFNTALTLHPYCLV